MRIGGVMRQRIWALLAVAAVLAMHGVQCMGGPVDSTHAPVAAVAPLTVLDGDAVVASIDGMHRVAALTAAATLPLHSAPGGMPAHGAEVWTICLAVAFAALALVSVVALSRGRAALLVRGPPPLLRLLRNLHRLPPAPDLSALCLLRI